MVASLPMAEKERRSSARVPVEMWVEEFTQDAQVFRRAANLSRGGVYLDQTIPLPVGTAVRLKFTLPGDAEPVMVAGQVVSVSAQGGPGMGIKFTDLPPTELARIEKYFGRLPTPLGI